LKNFLQRIFNFGQQEENKIDKAAFKEISSETIQKKRDRLSECCSLLRIAQTQKNEKLSTEALVTLEKIVEIMEREEF
jgi:Mg2+/Co2+ transporter CorC